MNQDDPVLSMYILKGSRIQAVSNSVKSYQTKGCGTHGEKQETNRHLLKTNATAAWVANIVPENLGRRYANHFRLTGLSYLYLLKKKKKKSEKPHINTSSHSDMHGSIMLYNKCPTTVTNYPHVQLPFQWVSCPTDRLYFSLQLSTVPCAFSETKA